MNTKPHTSCGSQPYGSETSTQMVVLFSSDSSGMIHSCTGSAVGHRSIRPRDGVFWVLQHERLADTQDGVSTWLDASAVTIGGGPSVKDEVFIQRTHDVHKPTIAVVKRWRTLLKRCGHAIHTRSPHFPLVALNVRLVVAVVSPIVFKVCVLVSRNGVELNVTSPLRR